LFRSFYKNVIAFVGTPIRKVSFLILQKFSSALIFLRVSYQATISSGQEKKNGYAYISQKILQAEQ